MCQSQPNTQEAHTWYLPEKEGKEKRQGSFIHTDTVRQPLTELKMYCHHMKSQELGLPYLGNKTLAIEQT